MKLALAVVVGTFVVQIDATMITVALDTLRASFGVSLAQLQWVSSSYLLAIAVTVPLVGWSADRFGSRRLWLAGLIIFVCASVFCGFAGSLGMLIAARCLQGVGGGILLTLSQAVLARAAGPEQLGRLMAIVAVPSLLGPIVGPIIGGLIVEGWGWQYIFFINVPICLAAIVLAWRWLRIADRGRPTRLDLLGAVLLAPGLAALLYGLTRAGSLGTIADGEVLGYVLGGGILLVCFGMHALRTRHAPLIDLRLFRSVAFASASALFFFIIMGLIGAMLLITLYFQLARGESPISAGLLIVPEGVGAALGVMVFSSLADRGHSAGSALVGAVMATAGLAALSQLGATTNDVYIGTALFVLGVGFGVVVVSASVAGYGGLAPEQISRAATVLRIVQQVGGSIGVAVLVIALQNALAGAASAASGAPSPAAAASAPNAPSATATAAMTAEAFGSTFAWAAALVGLAVIPAIVLVVCGSVARRRARQVTLGAPGGIEHLPQG
ncbi:multidrug resistance protein B [Subtercola lobariae]|uniref:Multidrug resistance protein B n=1 Tax=Subtercola lobariae TaxID=1588641 RepID=A0A917B821_9MICO|nr:multidrug resistance protein B [Subtercola lobariae]